MLFSNATMNNCSMTPQPAGARLQSQEKTQQVRRTQSKGKHSGNFGGGKRHLKG
jgi:hypothetical protein